MSVDLSLTATRVDATHEATEVLAGGGPATVEHDQRLSLADLSLGVDVGVADGWGVRALVPFRVVDTTIAYRDASGAEVAIENPELHHRDETLSGLADPWLLGRHVRRFGELTLDARAGVTLPLGATEEDPFRLGDLGMRHQHIQLGTGTVNAVASLEAHRAWPPFTLSAWALTMQVFYENGKGYQAGDRYAGGAGASSPLGTQDFRVRLGFEAQSERAERWHGEVAENEGNPGRIDVLAAAGAGWRWLDLSVKVPVYTDVDSGQLEYPVVLVLGAHFAIR